MYLIQCSLIALLVTPSIVADISVPDYVYWTKADISAWHQYFPSRLLEQERLTNLRAAATAEIVAEDMGTSLAATVRYQDQELRTAQLIMEGTSAQGCVQGISTYMDKAIDDGVLSYKDCAADVVPQLQRLYNSWTKTNASYQAAYQRALVGIDSCARTYPNRNSWGRLRTCVDSWTKNYFTIANGTISNLNWSPAMGVFSQYVAGCAQQASSRVVLKGWTFLSMLVQCSKLSENVDAEMYEKQMTSEFYKYITTYDLPSQIWNSQVNNRNQVSNAEKEMLHYYDLQKSALERYVIESRDQGYYYGQLWGYLRKYVNTVASTSVDNPGDAACVTEANNALDRIINVGAVNALECDLQIVNNTKLLIARVNNNFVQINNVLPKIGNVAIISCFIEGYIFAENTIFNCFSLTFMSFSNNLTEVYANIVADVDVLQGYEKSFFSNSSLPCGNIILSRAFLKADRTLYNLQRCLYISTGTKYDVTTSATYSEATPYTTIASPSSTSSRANYPPVATTTPDIPPYSTTPTSTTDPYTPTSALYTYYV